MNDVEDIYSEDAEKSILGILLIDSDKATEIYNRLTVDDFFLNQHKIIYKACTILLSQGKIADIVTVSERLKFDGALESAGGRDYVTELAEDVITKSNYENYIKIILKYSKKRQLLGASDEIKNMFENGSDVDTVAKYISDVGNKVLLTDTSTNMSSIFNAVTDVMDEVCKVLQSDTKTFGLDTGFKSINQTLSGLCGGQLYILGARPRVGKSAIAQQIAEYVATNHNVLFQSLEMRVSQYTKRSLFRKTSITNEMLTRNMVNVDEVMDKMAVASGDIAKLNLYIDDNSDCTLKTIEKNVLRMIKDKGSCDLIVIDYLQLMKSDIKKMYDRFDIVSRNSRGLKQLANKYNVPILVLCQLSRQVDNRDNKRPILSDLRDSGDIEQDADVVMFLYREEVYNPSPICKGKAELIIAKNREGTTRVIPMVFNGSKTEFREYNG